MAEVVYTLCALTSIVCAVLLLRGYARSGTRLLLWSGVCFVALAVNNLLVCVDLLLLPERDLRVYRQVAALLGIGLLLFGMVWEPGRAGGSGRGARP